MQKIHSKGNLSVCTNFKKFRREQKRFYDEFSKENQLDHSDGWLQYKSKNQEKWRI